MTEWIEETLHPDFRFKMKVDRMLFEGRSENQHVAVVENSTFGRTLYLDGVLQTSERDEFIYHEMLTHLPILAHGNVRDVLIIGGGDGGMLEETLKHRSVERVTMVEIDPSVVEMCREHLPSISKGAFDDPRLDLVFADGVDFVKSTEKRFDLVAPIRSVLAKFCFVMNFIDRPKLSSRRAAFWSRKMACPLSRVKSSDDRWRR